jgi:RNA polymerase sigma-70 factor (ECF subfamily)
LTYRSRQAGDGTPASYGAAAAALNASEGATRVAVHRLRRRYRELLRAEIAQTVNDPAEIDDEIRELFVALHG